jgi:ketosteroid isomerase-like protein
MPRSFIVSLLGAVLLMAVPARADDVRAAIDAANAKLVADYAAGDIKALTSAYTEDAVMLPPDATRVVGHEIETLWKTWIDAGITKLTLKSTDVDSSRDLAYEIGDLTLEVPMKDTKPTTATAKYLVVWKRGGDGVWRRKVQAWNGRALAMASGG